MDDRIPYKAALTFTVTLSPHWLEQFIGGIALTVGPALADSVDRYTRGQRLGYYPAFGFLADTGAIDRDLLDALEEVANVVREYAYREVRRQLHTVFPIVRFESIQVLAFMLPPVRPQRPNALALLARHYTPDVVKFNLGITARLDEAAVRPGRVIAHQAIALLEDHFAAVSLLSTRAA
jgi:hypothetical protein